MTSFDESGSKKSPTLQIKREQCEEDCNMTEFLAWYTQDTRKNACDKELTDSSGDDDHPIARKSKQTGSTSPRSPDNCGWCNKPLPNKSCQIISTPSGAFCSELCFSHSRRASFKKNKTCDWCRHVRHTVAYVDFQDGACQLQFCSDKCLNQYKMHIFCRETQAHLELHPHAPTTATDLSVAGNNLITPDLWLKNCKSTCDDKQPEQTSPLPLITIASPSKLMKDTKRVRQKRKLTTKHARGSHSPQDLRTNHEYEYSGDTVVTNLRINPELIAQMSNLHEGTTQPSQCYRQPVATHVEQLPKLPANLIPPPTILVPYPIIFPIPIPIPIPLPIRTFVQAWKSEESGASTERIDSSETVAETNGDEGGIDESGKEPSAKRKRICSGSSRKAKFVLA